MATAQEYYEDDSLHGNYQYVSLKDIIDAMEMESQDDDSYLKNTKRSTFLTHAKAGIKELNKSAANDILAVEITVGTDLTVVLPQDYVNYVRVSLVTDNYKLVPLNINRNMSIAIGYLQDHEYEILFDNEGGILTSDASNAYNKPFQIYEFDRSCMGGQFMLDTSQISKFGEFNVDERRGKLVFSSNLSGREIVLEYISDGLQWQYIDESDITIHKHIEEALKAFIIHRVVSNRRNVPRSYKEDKRREYKTLLHQSKLDRADFKLLEIDKVMRSKKRWL